MPITVNEDYRLRKLADKVASCNSILDIGCSQLPNIHLNNKNVTVKKLTFNNNTTNVPNTFKKLLEKNEKNEKSKKNKK